MKINEFVAWKMRRLCQIFPGLTITVRNSPCYFLPTEEIIMEVPYRGRRWFVCREMSPVFYDVEMYVNNTLQDMAHELLDGLMKEAPYVKD